MKNIAVIIITSLLVAVIALQILAALNIFPRQEQVEVCPVDAISMQGGKAVIDRKKCIGCRRCVAGIFPPVEIVRDTVFVSAAPAATLKTEKQPSAPPAAKPAKAPLESSTPNQTGYRVNAEKCIGCGLCTIYCPTGAIKMVNDKAVIDPAKCINCGLCKNGNNAEFKGCPVKAISGP